jgi:hypothetical protein
MSVWIIGILNAIVLAFLVKRIGRGAAWIGNAIQLGATINLLAWFLVGVFQWLFIA